MRQQGDMEGQIEIRDSIVLDMQISKYLIETEIKCPIRVESDPFCICNLQGSHTEKVRNGNNCQMKMK